ALANIPKDLCQASFAYPGASAPSLFCSSPEFYPSANQSRQAANRKANRVPRLRCYVRPVVRRVESFTYGVFIHTDRGAGPRQNGICYKAVTGIAGRGQPLLRRLWAQAARFAYNEGGGGPTKLATITRHDPETTRTSRRHAVPAR